MKYLVWNIRHFRANKVRDFDTMIAAQMQGVDAAFFLECQTNAAAATAAALTDVATNGFGTQAHTGYANCSINNAEVIVWAAPLATGIVVNNVITGIYRALGLGERYPVVFDVTVNGVVEQIAIFHAEGPARQFVSTKIEAIRNIAVDALLGDFNFEADEYMTLDDDIGQNDQGRVGIMKSGNMIRKSARQANNHVMYLKEPDGRAGPSTVNQQGKKTKRKRPIDMSFIRRQRYHAAKVELVKIRNPKKHFTLSDHIPLKINLF